MINATIVCGILILTDIICGTVAALRNKEMSSAIAREGMYNKCGEAMLLFIAIVANEALSIPPFDTLGISPNIAYLVIAYIGWMEIVSILENICKINPNLPFAKILLMFNIKVDTDKPNGIESETAPEK